MPITINLVDRVSDNFGHPITEIFKLMHRISEIGKNEEIILDYTKAAFTHPFFTLPLLLLIKGKNKQGYNIKVTSTFENSSVASYMENVSFPNMLSCDERSIDEVFEILDTFSNKTYVPLLSFPTGQDAITDLIRERFISHLNNLIRNIIALEDQPQLRTAINYMIAELISNIVHHAYEDNGYIFVQNYPTKRYLDICIGDIGRTLLESYQNFENNKYDVFNHVQALEAALSGKSTKGGIDRGYGISTSTQMLCDGMKGKFFMFSGNAVTFISSQQKEISNIELPGVNWDGVLICLRIPNQIPPKFDYINYTE